MTGTSAWLDVSFPLTTNSVTWPGQPSTESQRISDMDSGAVSNVSVLRTSLHTGTHMDAPLHFFAQGADITQAPFEVGMGPARVAWLKEGPVTRAAIEAYEARTYPLGADERILFRTANSDRNWHQEAFNKDYLAVEVDAARYLATRKLILIGVDYLSIAPFDNPVDTHRTLLGAGTWVIEGLDMRAVEEGVYEMAALPLKLEGGDASPIRVWLRPR
jgi:arylformamidase